MTQKTAKKAPQDAPHVEMAARIEEVAKEAKSALEDGVTATRDTLKTARDEAQKQLTQTSEKSAAFVRENPGLAMVGALGVGVLLGLALRKADRG
ncbi:DUF883 family protein [Ruegeria sp. HKCCE3926]|uniref:DUF883 family protein n=1 Tax=Ruegeria sp. HKCCE3926 TaxID=2794831 RepID=UPI001AEA2593|nr:DUF883 family protein [Ruegeria sp. HKCCE3926]